MKKLIFTLVALLATTIAYSQQTLVATLTHTGTTTNYYGTYALQQAHDAAANGDVINLSGGSFQAVDITKALTIRGNGMDGSNPTYIVEDFSINIASTVTERLGIEGCRISGQISILCTVNNPYFLKDYITYITGSDNNYAIKNGMFANCQLYYYDMYGASSVQFVNSYVKEFGNNDIEKGSASFVNCVVVTGSTNSADYIASSQLVNSIIYFANTSTILPSTSSAVNCVAIGSTTAFDNLQSKQNCTTAALTIFTDSDPLKDLTDAAKAQYLGNDSTPVGMYGGMLPYNTTPTYPRITKMNVASKSTTDGKLSVDVEVSSAE